MNIGNKIQDYFKKLSPSEGTGQSQKIGEDKKGQEAGALNKDAASVTANKSNENEMCSFQPDEKEGLKANSGPKAENEKNPSGQSAQQDEEMKKKMNFS